MKWCQVLDEENDEWLYCAEVQALFPSAPLWADDTHYINEHGTLWASTLTGSYYVWVAQEWRKVACDGYSMLHYIVPYTSDPTPTDVEPCGT